MAAMAAPFGHGILRRSFKLFIAVFFRFDKPVTFVGRRRIEHNGQKHIP
jgi:hypothetical protein